MAATSPVLGVVTSDYLRPGETFVNHHVARLFDGRNVVICREWTGDNPLSRPVFALKDQRWTPLDHAVIPAMAAVNLGRYRVPNVPAGSVRRELKSFLRDHDVSVLLAEFGIRAMRIAPLAESMGLPLFTYFRGSDSTKQLRKPHVIGAYRRMMPKLAGVFAVSRFLLDNLAQHGISHPRAEVIPSGADTELFRPGEKVPGEVVAVGRFVEKKAPMTTLSAFLEAARHVPEAHLHMVGDGPLLEPCKALAQEKGASGRVTFHGSLPHGEVVARLATASIFLQHSVTTEAGDAEGMPTAIQEAMAAGCAVISTRHAGIPEAVLEGVTGRLVEEHDSTSFSTAIGDLLSRADKAAGMGAAGRARALEHFDKDKLTARVEAIMLEHLAATRAE